MNGTDEELISKKITAKSALIALPPIKLSKLRKAANSSNTLELACTAVMTIQGQSPYDLESATVSCSILNSNRVLGLEVDAQRGTMPCASISQATQPDYYMDVEEQGESASNEVPVQFSFSVMSQFNLNIRAVTEDGVAYVPPADAIEVSTSFMRVPSNQTISKPTGVFIPSSSLFKGRPVPFHSLFRPLELAPEQLVLQRVDHSSQLTDTPAEASSSFVHPDVGLYEVVVSFSEKRPQFAAVNSKKVGRLTSNFVLFAD